MLATTKQIKVRYSKKKIVVGRQRTRNSRTSKKAQKLKRRKREKKDKSLEGFDFSQQEKLKYLKTTQMGPFVMDAIGSKHSVSDICGDQPSCVRIEESVAKISSFGDNQSRHEKHMPFLHEFWMNDSLEPLENLQNTFCHTLEQQCDEAATKGKPIDIQTNPSELFLTQNLIRQRHVDTIIDSDQSHHFSPRYYRRQGRELGWGRPSPTNLFQSVECLHNCLFTPVVTSNERRNCPSPVCAVPFGSLIDFLNEAQMAEPTSAPHLPNSCGSV
jgi:hypothetical protein